MNPFNFPFPSIEVSAVMPIAIMAVTGILALIIEMVTPKRDNNLIVGVSLAGLALAAVAIFMQLGGNSYLTAADTVRLDPFGLVTQLIIVVVTALAIIFSESYLREKRIPFGEFYPLVLWSATGGMIMCTTTNLLMIFIGLEILSIALYVMAGMSRSEEKSEESALKYFLLGAFASGFLLYGIGLFYGATGSLQLETVSLAWVRNEAGSRALLVFGLGLMLIGLSFKSSFVPFHQWTPDVYQGAPTNVTAFMAAGSKVAAIAALWRVLDATSMLTSIWIPALSIIAVLTMTVGNLVALTQKDVKRTLGYSSIAHAGYILVGILAHAKSPGTIGTSTVLFYLLSYSLMTVGAFAVVSLAANQGRESTRFESLNGMAKQSPILAVLLVVFVSSLIGIPPTSGFLAKLWIFQDALRADLGWLALVLALNSAISVYYYLGIVYAAVIVEPKEDAPRIMAGSSSALKLTCAICAAGVIAAGVFFTPLLSMLGIESNSAAGLKIAKTE